MDLTENREEAYGDEEFEEETDEVEGNAEEEEEVDKDVEEVEPSAAAARSARGV